MLTCVLETEWLMATMEPPLTPRRLCSKSLISILVQTSPSKQLSRPKHTRVLRRLTISWILSPLTTPSNRSLRLIISLSKSRLRVATIPPTSWLKTSSSTETWEIPTPSEVSSLTDSVPSTATHASSSALKPKSMLNHSATLLKWDRLELNRNTQVLLKLLALSPSQF